MSLLLASEERLYLYSFYNSLPHFNLDFKVLHVIEDKNTRLASRIQAERFDTSVRSLLETIGDSGRNVSKK